MPFPCVSLDTVSHWALAGGPLFYMALYNLGLRNEKIAQKTDLSFIDCTNKELVERIRNILEKMGLPAQEIIIKKWANKATAVWIPLKVFHNKLIVINEEHALSWSQEELEGWIAHEASHIINNDVNKVITASLLAPFLTHLLCRSIAYASNISYVLTAQSGSLELCISLFTFIMYLRYQEKNADLKAATLLPTSMTGLIKAFKHCQMIGGGNNYFDFTHPLLSTRITYLEKALEEHTQNALKSS
jgi:Zn-dependent protease with chaperone function